MRQKLLICVACLSLAGTGAALLHRQRCVPAVEQAARPAEIAPRAVLVRAVRGVVERWRAGQRVGALAIGDQLLLDDLIGTGPNSSVTLDVGESRVEVDGRSRVSVLELAQNLSRVRLDDGRLSAEVHGGSDRRLRVEVKGTTARAETPRARFSMLTDGRGAVSLATFEGSVGFTALGRSIDVGAGYQSVATAQQPPSPPEKIPPSLLLKIARLNSGIQRDARTVVGGVTGPGAVVSVNGARVTARADGSFDAEVPLVEGENRLVVGVQDVSGRTHAEAVPGPTVQSTAPPLRSAVKW